MFCLDLCNQSPFITDKPVTAASGTSHVASRQAVSGVPRLTIKFVATHLMQHPSCFSTTNPVACRNLPDILASANHITCRMITLRRARTFKSRSVEIGISSAEKCSKHSLRSHVEVIEHLLSCVYLEIRLWYKEGLPQLYPN